MAENSEKLFKKLKIGDQIVLSVPKVVRGPLDNQNINGLVIDIRNGVYQVGTAVGIIKNWCSREGLKLVSNNSLEDRVPKDKCISLREAVATLSNFNGQGLLNVTVKQESDNVKPADVYVLKKMLNVPANAIKP